MSCGALSSSVELRNVSRRFGETRALAGIGAVIREREFFSLLGPSGCGKTTLLRIIAGLDWPDEGSVWIGGEEMTGIPAHQRPVNTVFQSYALFPHLNVWDNIAFGLRMTRAPRDRIAERVGRVMETMRISDLAKRKPANLSGGQRQRVALARAIVNEPQVLLLDEPLGALDLGLRKQLQVELHVLQRKIGMTFIYVTHDQEEALSMSDRIALMSAGGLIQTGSPKDVYDWPRTRFAAEFLGACNMLDGKVAEVQGGYLRVETAIGLVEGRSSVGKEFAAGDRCSVAIRPEKVELRGSTGPRNGNVFEATVERLVYTGAKTQLQLRIRGVALQAAILNNHPNGGCLETKGGFEVFFPPDGVVVVGD